MEDERKEIALAAVAEERVKRLLGTRAGAKDGEGVTGRLGGGTETSSCLMGEGGRDGTIDKREKAASIAAAS